MLDELRELVNTLLVLEGGELRVREWLRESQFAFLTFLGRSLSANKKCHSTAADSLDVISSMSINFAKSLFMDVTKREDIKTPHNRLHSWKLLERLRFSILQAPGDETDSKKKGKKTSEEPSVEYGQEFDTLNDHLGEQTQLMLRMDVRGTTTEMRAECIRRFGEVSDAIQNSIQRLLTMLSRLSTSCGQF